MAIRLGKAFGGRSETWLRLQMAYDLAQARKREKEIHVQRFPPCHPRLSMSRVAPPKAVFCVRESTDFFRNRQILSETI
jgi:hypothetical protein